MAFPFASSSSVLFWISSLCLVKGSSWFFRLSVTSFCYPGCERLAGLLFLVVLIVSSERREKERKLREKIAENAKDMHRHSHLEIP